MKLSVGQSISKLRFKNIQGRKLNVPNSETPWLHIQFRRFAGCPICNLHLREVMRRHNEILDAGIKELVFFHSTAESMLPYQGQLPFDVVADPDKVQYKAFGVETSLLGTLHPKSWLAAVLGLCTRNRPNPFAGNQKGHLGMPADFLIDSTGQIVALKYGKFADDQWSVDELLALAKKLR